MFPAGTLLGRAGRSVRGRREGGEAFIVTARDMTEAEKKTFHRKAQ